MTIEEDLQAFVYAVANEVRSEHSPLFTEFAFKLHARVTNQPSSIGGFDFLRQTERHVIATAEIGFTAWANRGADAMGMATSKQIVAFTVRLFLAWIEIRETDASASVGAGVSA